MSSRSFRGVIKAFQSEVERSFGFLANEYGLVGPNSQGITMPVIAFVGTGLRYRVMLDDVDKTVVTRVEVDTDSACLVAELDSLVVAAGLARQGAIEHRVSSLRDLKQVLDSHAGHVKSLHPMMIAVDRAELMRKASARKWTR